MKKLLLLFIILIAGCDYAPTEHSHSDIDALKTENAEQDAMIDSLLTIITTQAECWSGDYTNHIDLMEAVQSGYIFVTKAANSEDDCDEGEVFFWAHNTNSSTDNYDYCADNGSNPVNNVHNDPCCNCGGCLISNNICN